MESANTGEEAIAKFHARPCDLVLLDLNMPAKDGWAAFEGISRLRPLVPVIVITARPHQYERAIGVGVDALMEKPLDLPLLLQCVRELLAESEAARLARLTAPNFATRYLDEPEEMRLARIAGQPAEFHYFPAQRVSKRWYQPHAPASNSAER